MANAINEITAGALTQNLGTGTTVQILYRIGVTPDDTVGGGVLVNQSGSTSVQRFQNSNVGNLAPFNNSTEYVNQFGLGDFVLVQSRNAANQVLRTDVGRVVARSTDSSTFGNIDIDFEPAGEGEYVPPANTHRGNYSIIRGANVVSGVTSEADFVFDAGVRINGLRNVGALGTDAQGNIVSNSPQAPISVTIDNDPDSIDPFPSNPQRGDFHTVNNVRVGGDQFTQVTAGGVGVTFRSIYGAGTTVYDNFFQYGLENSYVGISADRSTTTPILTGVPGNRPLLAWRPAGSTNDADWTPLTTVTNEPLVSSDVRRISVAPAAGLNGNQYAAQGLLDYGSIPNGAQVGTLTGTTPSVTEVGQYIYTGAEWAIFETSSASPGALTGGDGISSFTFNGTLDTAVNVDFGGSGTATTVSRSDHTHLPTEVSSSQPGAIPTTTLEDDLGLTVTGLSYNNTTGRFLVTRSIGGTDSTFAFSASGNEWVYQSLNAGGAREDDLFDPRPSTVISAGVAEGSERTLNLHNLDNPGWTRGQTGHLIAGNANGSVRNVILNFRVDSIDTASTPNTMDIVVTDSILHTHSANFFWAIYPGLADVPVDADAYTDLNVKLYSSGPTELNRELTADEDIVGTTGRDTEVTPNTAGDQIHIGDIDTDLSWVIGQSGYITHYTGRAAFTFEVIALDGTTPTVGSPAFDGGFPDSMAIEIVDVLYNTLTATDNNGTNNIWSVFAGAPSPVVEAAGSGPGNLQIFGDLDDPSDPAVDNVSITTSASRIVFNEDDFLINLGTTEVPGAVGYTAIVETASGTQIATDHYENLLNSGGPFFFPINIAIGLYTPSLPRGTANDVVNVDRGLTTPVINNASGLVLAIQTNIDVVGLNGNGAVFQDILMVRNDTDGNGNRFRVRCDFAPGFDLARYQALGINVPLFFRDDSITSGTTTTNDPNQVIITSKNRLSFDDTPNVGNTLGVDFTNTDGVITGTVNASGISGGGGGTSITVQEEGGLVEANVSVINFIGADVTAADGVNTGIVNVTVAEDTYDDTVNINSSNRLGIDFTDLNNVITAHTTPITADVIETLFEDTGVSGSTLGVDFFRVGTGGIQGRVDASSISTPTLTINDGTTEIEDTTTEITFDQDDFVVSSTAAGHVNVATAPQALSIHTFEYEESTATQTWNIPWSNFDATTGNLLTRPIVQVYQNSSGTIWNQVIPDEIMIQTNNTMTNRIIITFTTDVAGFATVTG